MTPVSLDISRKIAQLAKEKGTELPGSYFVYNIYQGDALLCPRENALEMDEHVNAYTADEIADMLPSKIESNGDEYNIDIYFTGSGRKRYYYARYMNPCSSHSLADALGLLLIWLLEQGYMEVKL